MPAMADEELLYTCRGPVAYDVNVLIARRPWINQQLPCFELVRDAQVITQPVQRVSQRLPPILVPLGPPSGVAATTAGPPAHSMGTAPCSVFLDARFLSRRMQRQIFAVIRQLRQFVFFDVVQCI